MWTSLLRFTAAHAIEKPNIKGGNMASNTVGDGAIKLGGREFRRVRNGLDEAQIAPFIDELSSQRDKLLQSQEHLSSLTRLAEKTVIEADKLAEQIKTEAIEQAKAESTAILAKTKKQAQQIRRRFHNELSNFVQQIFGQFLSEHKNLKQQAVAAQAEFEHKLSQLEEESKGFDEFPELNQSTGETERHGGHSEPFKTVDPTKTSELQWEVEVLPPIDMGMIVEFVTHLDQLPEVKSTDIIPRIDRPAIMVFLREPMSLIDVLRTLPVVAHVEEDTTDTAVAEGKPRKAQISLSGKIVPQE